jgi:hypothetical protein
MSLLDLRQAEMLHDPLTQTSHVSVCRCRQSLPFLIQLVAVYRHYNLLFRGHSTATHILDLVPVLSSIPDFCANDALIDVNAKMLYDGHWLKTIGIQTTVINLEKNHGNVQTQLFR